jgi:hypothetical protein
MLDTAIGSRAWAARRVMPAILLLALAAAVAYAAWFLGRTTSYPHALDYGEGPLLDQAVRLAHGESIYRIPGAQPPWTVSNYPPVYLGIEAALAAVFGPAYWYGRLVSVLSLAGSAVLVGAIVYRLTTDRFASVVAALLAPAMPYVGYWAALARVDNLALLLSLAGLWCVLRWPERTAALLAAIGLMALAAYTRHTYLLVAPVTAFVWLLGHSWRRAFALAGGLAALVLLGGLVLNAATQGGFWFNIVTANVNEFSWEGVLYYLVSVPQQVPVLLLAAVAYTIVAVRDRLPSARVIGPYLTAGTLLIVTAGKIGSSVNYLMECGVGLCLAVGGLLDWLRSRPRLFPITLGLLALQSMYSVLVPPWWYGWALEGMDDSASRGRISQVLGEAAGGDVLTDQEMGELPLDGRSIVLQPFEMTQLARAGLWDQTPVVTSIEQHRFAAILIYTIPDYPLEKDRWSAEMLAAIDHAYVAGPRIGTESGGSVVYTPRR